MSDGGRLAYVDWLRGVAVLLMIQTHVYDSWLGPQQRGTPFFRWSRALGGAPAPLFLFLAGVALALLAESRRRRVGGAAARSEAGRRALEVLAYAALFRLWMFTTGGFTRPADLLRVDVLNCIGLSMALLAAAALGLPSFAGRLAAAIGTAAVVGALTPFVWDVRPEWASPWLRAYWSGREPGALFPLFPWAGFTAVGTAAGLVLDRSRRDGREGSAIAALAVLGAGGLGGALALDRLAPPLHAAGDFWLTAPSFFLARAGILLLLLAAAWLWHRTRWTQGWSGVGQLGRTSLLVYWVHVEIVYGFATRWARARLDVAEASYGLALLIVAMLLLSWWRTAGPLSRLPGIRLPARAA